MIKIYESEKVKIYTNEYEDILYYSFDGIHFTEDHKNDLETLISLF